MDSAKGRKPITALGLYSEVFGPILNTICPSGEAMNDRVPERPLQPPHDVGESPEFDPYDDQQMESLFGKRIGKPVGDLLQLYRTAKLAQGSFGMDDKKFAEQVMPILKQLAEGAVLQFREDW